MTTGAAINKHQRWLLVSGLGVCATVSTNKTDKSGGLQWRRRETVLILDMVRLRSREASGSLGLRKEVGADYTIWVPLH